MQTLSQCPPLQVRQVTSLRNSALTPKLTEMGFYPGKHVRVLFRAPLGDPIAVDVDGYTLSLRREEAALIQVR